MAAISDVEKNNILGSRFLIGGTVFKADDLPKLKTLHAYHSSNFATLREMGQTSGYQVPAGKKFVVVAVVIRTTGGSVGASLGLWGADSDVGFSSGSAPSNTDPTVNSSDSNVYVMTAASELIELSSPYEIAATKYPYVYVTSGVGVWHVYGFELDADAETL